MLVEFHDSPELQAWIDVAETAMSDGKQVAIKLDREGDGMRCEILTCEPNERTDGAAES